MNTATNPLWTPEQTVEHFQQQINLPVLKDMLTTFFQAKASDKGDKLLRRPPIAVRLLDGVEHVYTVRPGWKSPAIRLFDKMTFQPNASDDVLDTEACGGRYVRVQQHGRFEFDKLFVDAVHQEHGKCAKFVFDGTTMRLTSWYHSRYFEALQNFAQTAKEFVLFPWQVFSRSADHCCICGKPLIDDISRGRGIGPECLRHVSNCFGQPLRGAIR